ncbi:hypothetical protein RFI_23621 [Reticulomyxa filosa]|uniref:Uncharacterized protein n=1 Tax=Reticulomyxa filosa TaxID=46433 RepID=X6MIA8_RETFI|nr:hypothetical protein RFI_23621 [Reticulomyxa filosa]|eukprot:ETO13748.1 hypothetical protein RFI_23621 [Reticulomyxa filosa]
MSDKNSENKKLKDEVMCSEKIFDPATLPKTYPEQTCIRSEGQDKTPTTKSRIQRGGKGSSKNRLNANDEDYVPAWAKQYRTKDLIAKPKSRKRKHEAVDSQPLENEFSSPPKKRKTHTAKASSSLVKDSSRLVVVFFYTIGTTNNTSSKSNQQNKNKERISPINESRVESTRRSQHRKKRQQSGALSRTSSTSVSERNSGAGVSTPTLHRHPKSSAKAELTTPNKVIAESPSSIRSQRVNRLTDKTYSDLLLDLIMKRHSHQLETFFKQVNITYYRWQMEETNTLLFDGKQVNILGFLSLRCVFFFFFADEAKFEKQKEPDGLNETMIVLLLRHGANPCQVNADGLSSLFMITHYSKCANVLQQMIQSCKASMGEDELKHELSRVYHLPF